MSIISNKCIFGLYIGQLLISGEGATGNATTAKIKGATIKVEGVLEFNDPDNLPIMHYFNFICGQVIPFKSKTTWSLAFLIIKILYMSFKFSPIKNYPI